MTHSVLFLAATAAAAVPGLSPVLVREVRARAGARFQVGFVEDSQRRRWVVRVPRDAVSGAAQDASAELLTMIARRLPFAVPAPEGFVSVSDRGRAMVYPYLDGRPLRAVGLPGGPGPAAELGRAIAAVHNLDRGLYEELTLPSYDAEESRRRHLADLDRGAGTGRVPQQLLSRWERRLDDVSLWRFAPATLHGRLAPHHALALFDDPEDATSGRIGAVLGWDHAFVGDPAEDLAAVVGAAPRDAVDAVLEAYAMARPEVPDPHLEQRAHLLVELRMLDDVLAALANSDQQATEEAVDALRALAREVGQETTGHPANPTSTAPPTPGGGAVSVVYEPHPTTDQLYQAGSPPTAVGPVGSAGGQTTPPSEGRVSAHQRRHRSAEDVTSSEGAAHRG
ncbi:MAG TPA: phosphotransferase [Dermatophilaceae bacterium]|nr:phosphotransferase [Dermatophilaceae bacterium]